MALITLSRAEEKLPFSAETALSKMDMEIERAKATAVTALKKSLDEETKKGNLQAALAIQRKIDALNPAYFLGKWYQSGKYMYELKADGSISVSDGNKGKWTATKSTLTCVFPNGSAQFTLPAKDGMLSGSWAGGSGGYKWTREK